MLRLWEPQGEEYLIKVLSGSKLRWQGVAPLRMTRTRHVRLVYGGSTPGDQIALTVQPSGCLEEVALESCPQKLEARGTGLTVIVALRGGETFWALYGAEKPGWRRLEGIEGGEGRVGAGVAVVELRFKTKARGEMPSPPSRHATSSAPPPPLSLFDPL